MLFSFSKVISNCDTILTFHIFINLYVNFFKLNFEFYLIKVFPNSIHFSNFKNNLNILKKEFTTH